MMEKDDEVDVRYLDYGGFQHVKASALRQIRSDFMNLPFQVINQNEKADLLAFVACYEGCEIVLED